MQSQPEDMKEIEEILEQLSRPETGRDAISLLTVKLIETRFPAIKVEFVSESEAKIINADGKSSAFHFHNLWVECEQTPEEKANIVDRYVRVLVAGSDEPEDKTISFGSIVAMVRDRTYRDYACKQEGGCVTKHLVADLWIILAVDRPESIAILRASDVSRPASNSDDLFPLGAVNVAALLSNLAANPFGECFVLSCENISYASSTLLLDDVWDQLAGAVDGDIVLAAPARDTILFTGSQNTEGLKQLREAAEHVVRTGHHIISETLLRWVDGAWKPFS